MDAFQEACRLLPSELSRALCAFPAAEEIRLRAGRLPSVVLAGTEQVFSAQPVSTLVLQQILERATGASMHTAAPALANGYLPCGRLRIGVCGEGIMKGDSWTGFRSFGSLAIRIPHTAPEIDPVILSLVSQQPLRNTLIVAPPGVGKTSCLRELVRLVSDHGIRVSVADERNELAASENGRPGFNLGQCSDVIIGLPKLPAAMMLLRGMNPQLIAMDEITCPEDLNAIREITGCGVVIYATAHGRSTDDMRKRQLYQGLFSHKVFHRAIVISLSEGRRIYTMENLDL